MPYLVGRRRGYRVLDGALRHAFPGTFAGEQIVPHGDGLISYNLGSYIHRLMAYEWFGEESRLLLARLLRPGDTFVDAGSHLGFFTVQAAALVGTQGVVHAIEANPATVVRLRRNASLNSGLAKIEVHAFALSDQGGERLLLHGAEAESDSFIQRDGSATGTVEVAGASLDDLSATWGKIRLLKIDIEGSETLAFRGASRWLASPGAPAFILAEVNPAMLARAGSSAAELIELLASHGYRPFSMRFRTSRRVALGPAHPVEQNEDFLFARDSSLDELTRLGLM